MVRLIGLLSVCCILLPLSVASQTQVLQPPMATLADLDRMIAVQSFDCSNQTCDMLSGCEEACHKLLVCGQSIRDRDNDGIPCESVCSRRC
ncbi:hypothetical protein SAMN04488003_10114 [Loktanella fryxellensis]|uniref:Excalibur calcium-binding domain-containing protein n=1 Tax=Loktanella fryxellensis TaxID=245187 RepID=A0A1H7Y5J8_9RHOB|nr:hypothetical protein [Loktanella fryxellensis]SEM41410.1 hypothetical protein SAMN04488003_10114 [Loktanella fryxellensis]